MAEASSATVGPALSQRTPAPGLFIVHAHLERARLLHMEHKTGKTPLPDKTNGKEPGPSLCQIRSNFKKAEAGTDTTNFVLHVFRSFHFFQETKTAIFLCSVQINRNVEGSGVLALVVVLAFATTLPMLPAFGDSPVSFL